jgi:hypothetical protein
MEIKTERGGGVYRFYTCSIAADDIAAAFVVQRLKLRRFKMNKILGTILLVGLLLLSGCAASAPTATPVPPTATPIPAPPPDSVAVKLAQAVNAQDLDAALALFAEDAIVNTGGLAPFTGKAEIQAWLEGMFADNFKLKIEILEVNGDKVVEKDTMTMNSMAVLGIPSLEGISEITVQGVEITALNFTFTEESLSKLPLPISSVEGLVGIWHQTPTNPFLGELYIQYKEDGTYRVAAGAADRLESHPLIEGEYWFEGGQLFDKSITGISPWDECVGPEQVGKYDVLLFSTGNIKLVKVEDECSGRVQVLPGEYELVPEQ